MSKYKKILFKLLALVLVPAAVYAGFIKVRSMLVTSERPLAVKWEGFYHDSNFRDIGESINLCYKEDVMKTGVVFRSNGWFSGWSCQQVGNPDRIISLNYDPRKDQQSFCWDSSMHKAILGEIPNYDKKLSDMEFVKSWENSAKIDASCSAVRAVMQSILYGGKTLVHCDAGRDRTGWMAALLGMMVLERVGADRSRSLDAVECDYRKTGSLKEYKYGRMARFFGEISDTASVSDFLAEKCGIDKKYTADVADALSAGRS